MLAVCAVAGFGCGSSEPPPTLAGVEYLYLEGDYQGAVAAAKERLLEYPGDAGAHFYFGSAQMAITEPWVPLLAMGELETALALFERGGKVSPIDRFGDTYFELRCHLDIAKVGLRHLLSLEGTEAPPGAVAMLLRRIELALEDARKVLPEAAEVKQLEAILQQIRSGTKVPPDQQERLRQDRPSGGSWPEGMV